jgi:tetratricopeptide (TPR) repeat protein
VQAVAEVSAISPQDSRNLRFTLLAAGSVRPDVISLNLADPESMAAAVKALGAAPALMDLSTGIQLVDARDVRGAVVVRSRVEIGLLPGDVIVAADKTEVGDTADFESYVARTRPGATLVLEVKRRGVSTAPIQVRVVSTPRVVGFYDKSLLANKLLLQFRLLAGEAADPDQQAAARLNLAVALMVLGRWDEAETELRQVSLPDGPGVSKGTVKYLLGLCLDELKRVPEANEAYGEAMLVREALLTTDGPLIRGLAEAKLRDKTRRNP